MSCTGRGAKNIERGQAVAFLNLFGCLFAHNSLINHCVLASTSDFNFCCCSRYYYSCRDYFFVAPAWPAKVNGTNSE